MFIKLTKIIVHIFFVVCLLIFIYLYKDIKDFNSSLGTFCLGCIILYLGACIYWLKCKRRCLYAFIELFFSGFSLGYLASLLMVSVEPTLIIGFLGGVYVIVRSFDNMKQGLEELEDKNFLHSWNQFFPSFKK